MPTENRSSNTEMVSVPRELAENLAHALYEHDANGLTVQLQEWLDKPAEQRQGEPAGYFTFCHDKNKWLQGKPKGPEFLHFFTPLYTHADPGEAERLRGIIRMHEKTVREQADHLAYMRAQLAERDALLHSLDCAWNSHDGKERFGKLMRKVETLAASAEPCAAVEVDHDALVAAVCVLRSQGLGNLSAAVEEARTALERKPS